MEELLAAIWREVLATDRIGRRDDFFALGGHSLLATQVVSRIRRALDVDLPVRALFEAPTLERLALRLAHGERSAGPPLVPVPRDRPLPLSFGQQRLWFLDRLEPGSAAYNLPAALRLAGRLDVGALERALQAVVARHEVLRTVFVANADGRAAQVIAPALPVSLAVSEVPSHDVARLVAEEAARPFDLTRGPLLRARLLRLAEREHVLLFTMHHVVSDAWSMGVLVRELSTLYQAFQRGEPSPLPPLPLQYADYAVWQRALLDEGRLQGELAFWRGQLAGAPGALALPTDRPRTEAPAREADSVEITLPPAVTSGLEALAQAHGATPFMVLLAAFHVLLARYADEETVVVGTPIAGRTRVETEGLIGFFVNTLALRADVRGSFLDLLAQVKERVLGAFAHQLLPFERLVDALELSRELSRSPVFQVLFTFQNAPAAALALGDVALEPLGNAGGRSAKLDLELTLHPAGDALRASWLYKRALFERSTIERLARSFLLVLEGIVRAPATHVRQLPLMTAREREALLVEWNRTAAPPPPASSLQALVAAQARRTPDAIALVAGGQALAYQELDARAGRIARRLQELGVRGDVRVGVCMARSPSLLLALLAILKAGGAYVPLDPGYPAERLAFMIEDAAVALVIADDPAQGLPFATLERQATAEPVRPTPVHGESLAYVIYTSGSTGRPKGVMVTHQGLLNYLTWALARYPVTAGAGALVHSSLAFDLTVTGLFAPLLAGSTVHLLGEASDLPEALRRAAHPFSLVKLTPAHLELLAAALHPSELAGKAHAFVVGGENLLQSHVAPWRTHAPATVIFNEYGPTETVVGCAVHAVTDADAGPALPIGRPTANTQLYVLDAEMAPVPAGVAGELFIGGAQVARGYHGRPQWTAERFLPDPFSESPGARMYRTGDLCRWTDDGALEFRGRRDHQVKIRGFRIELGDVESALSCHPAVRAAACTVIDERRIVAYVVTSAPVEELRAFVRAKLPEYMVPSWFVSLDAMPLTPSGKIDREGLPAAGPHSKGSTEPPRTDVERILVAIWRETLGLADVGVEDNFFELGGDSILSLQVVSRAARRGLRITPKQIFETRTLAALAKATEGAAGVAADQGPVVGPSPLTPIQAWFFAGEHPEPHHFNQALLLEIDARLDASLVEAAFERLLEHHDALRTRFHRTPDGWRAEVVGPAALSNPVV
ncbi:MAG TPA: amino acid adenylation domain-containing protein, partial [Solirubrobacterales bacterium]|nr:amino acid adenylation domain-containing protein [Solirubrobacterales bacterium]